MLPRAFHRKFSSGFKPIQFPPTIKQLLESPPNESLVTITGYVKSVRRHRNTSFAVIADGSTSTGLQVVFFGKNTLDLTKGFNTGSAIRLTGRLTDSPGRAQSKELVVSDENVISVLGGGGQDYPLQKKSHTPEFLRDWVHIRARTDATGAMLRFRHDLQNAISDFFQNHQFTYIHTPILTGNDAEGAGEAFKLAPVPPRISETSGEQAKEDENFFMPPAHLTVSAQLHLEAMTQALGRTWVLGPCFRAERSATRRHLSEFWMLEAEWVLSQKQQQGVDELMSFVESLVRQVTKTVLVSSKQNIEVFSSPSPSPSPSPSSSSSPSEPPHMDEIIRAIDGPSWGRLSYTEAINALQTTPIKFNVPPKWGNPLQTEHEKWLCEQYLRGPLFVYDYPRMCKSFYMRVNDSSSSDSASDSSKETVACFDLLLPSICELAGGSVRENRMDMLTRHLVGGGETDMESLAWYLDLRKFGGLPTGGFGIGFERWVSWMLGVENVRDCIGVPRSVGRLLM